MKELDKYFEGTTLDEVAEDIEIADGKPKGTYSGGTLKPRLQTLMTPWMNEGFFAKVVVLVEGEEDRAIILGTSTSLGLDFESLGISVIPCMGKNNLLLTAAHAILIVFTIVIVIPIILVGLLITYLAQKKRSLIKS